VSKNVLSSLIVLNWNGKEDTKECLLSLSSLEYKNFEVILVDNGSEDNSVLDLESFIKSKKFEYKIKFVKNKKNLGFTGGNIKALRHCRGNYIVLLNNDTVVDPKWLSALIKRAESDKKIGVVGGRAYFWNKKNPPFNKKNQFYSYQIIDPWLGYAHTTLNKKEKEVVDSISGCAVLIKREAINKVGFLDPLFFAYYEETDLFARIIRAGYKVFYEPSAAVWHQVAKSSGGRSYFYLYQMFRNRAIFAIRNFDEPYFSYFKRDYFKKGFRILGSFFSLSFGKKGEEYKKEVRARFDSFLWVIKNWNKLIRSRKLIVQKGAYNKKLRWERDCSVSVIIPNYNYGKYVGVAIKSALDQTVKPVEVIVVDDGSTDNSIDVIKKYPVKLIRQKNSGVVCAKNRGFKESVGRYVLFLDADDILRKNAIKKYLLKIKKNNWLGFVYSDMQYFGAEKKLYKSREFSIKRLKKVTIYIIQHLLRERLLRLLGVIIIGLG